MNYDKLKQAIQKAVPRLITLADVLMAISDKGDKNTPTPIWAIDMAGEFFDQSSDDGSPIYLDKVWNLKEDLEGQSDETKKFLEDLLT